MTKPIDPEIKAMRAVFRAVKLLDNRTRRRVFYYFAARFGLSLRQLATWAGIEP
jgi:hypothetical protein